MTSKQEKYIVVYTRNDTGKSVNIETREKFAELRDLYPGAEYRIQVLAVSHGLQSEPHTTHTAVLPNPAHNLSVAAVRDNTVTLRWLPPRNSRFTEYQVPRPSPLPPLLYCAGALPAAGQRQLEPPPLRPPQPHPVPAGRPAARSAIQHSFTLMYFHFKSANYLNTTAINHY